MQTGLGREEPKALKDLHRIQPCFMDVHYSISRVTAARPHFQVLQGPALSNIPVPPASRDGICGEPFPAAGAKGKQKEELKGWLANIGTDN